MILQQNCLNKWIWTAPIGTRFYNIQPHTSTPSSQTPTPKISKLYLFIISCFIDHVNILFFYDDANCENLSLVAEYCYRGDAWRIIGYFSATAALLVLLESKGKGNCIAVMEYHVTATECHLPYGITQCYLLPDTSERTPPSPQPIRPVLDLPRRDRRLSWPRWLVTYRDGLLARRRPPIQVLTGPSVD